MQKQPVLSEDEWPEIRRNKASRSTAWEYYRTLTKLLDKEVGRERTLPILEKFFSANAKKYLQSGMEKLGIEDNDAWAIASYFKLTAGDILGCRIDLVAKRGGKVALQYHVPSVIDEDLKMVKSYCPAETVGASTACTIINSGITVIQTQIVASDDPYCEVVFSEEEDDQYPQWTILRKQPKLPKADWAETRIIKAGMNTGWAYYTDLTRLLYAELGEEETVSILTKYFEILAKRYFKPTMKKFGIPGRDPWSLASYFKLATGDAIGYRMELVQETPNRVSLRYYPPCLLYPKLDIPVSYCIAETNFEKTVCKMMNPKVRVGVPQLMTRGDPYCEITFEEFEE